MSRAASRLSRKDRAHCPCGHHALFFAPGSRTEVRARRDHPLCFRCWRAALSRDHAHEMAAAHARRLHFVPGPFALV